MLSDASIYLPNLKFRLTTVVTFKIFVYNTRKRFAFLNSLYLTCYSPLTTKKYSTKKTKLDILVPLYMSVIVPPGKFMQISQSTIIILQQSPEHFLSSLRTSFNYWSLHLKLDLKISLTITFWFSRISWTYHVQMNLHSYPRQDDTEKT